MWMTTQSFTNAMVIACSNSILLPVFFSPVTIRLDTASLPSFAPLCISPTTLPNSTLSLRINVHGLRNKPQFCVGLNALSTRN